MLKPYVLIAILGTVGLGMGGVLQKRGLSELPELEVDWWIKEGKIQWGVVKEVTKTILNPFFISGCVSGFVGWALYVVALSMGEITIVQPLQGAANFWPVFLGVLWLKEKLIRLEYLGVAGMIAGIVILNGAA